MPIRFDTMFRGLLWPDAVRHDRANNVSFILGGSSPLTTVPVATEDLSSTSDMSLESCVGRAELEDIDEVDDEGDYEEDDDNEVDDAYREEDQQADDGAHATDADETQGPCHQEDDDEFEDLWHRAWQGDDSQYASTSHRRQVEHSLTEDDQQLGCHDSRVADDEEKVATQHAPERHQSHCAASPGSSHRRDQYTHPEVEEIDEHLWKTRASEEELAAVFDTSRRSLDDGDDSFIYDEVPQVESQEYYSDSDAEDEAEERERAEELERRFQTLYSRPYENIIPPVHLEPGVREPRESWSAVGRVPTVVLIAGREIQPGNGLSRVVYVRSVGEQINGYGLERGSVWAMKTFRYFAREENPEAYARRELHIRSEIEAYRRIGHTCDYKKPGFEFLMQMEGYLANRYVDAFVFELMYADLRMLLNEGRVGRSDCPRLLAQMATGIATLHSVGIIHRDVKPENVLIDAKGNVKITDFGLSFVTKLQCPIPAGYDFTERDEDNWQRGLVGTREYMAPEMISMSKTILEIDYFSLGCVFFEMLTGRTLFGIIDFELEEWIRAWNSGKSAQLWYLGRKVANIHPRDPAIDLLRGLLCVEPSQRYGIARIIPHAYFITDKGRQRSEFDYLDDAYNRETIYDMIPGNSFLGITTRHSFIPALRKYGGWLNPSGFFLVGHE
ncbi:hypothetical protein NLJ89_g1384 [Agrocybe chaxingu]|uniref:Protein kinase domain-containing protein n=1 Tax=Agrocybe chaxingu TaxID=84603 RepID=A0A9W8TFB2_9AGAR|nr:hypothetical protein NLJ89_g1384 [Agrocybe chaxingu]